MSDRFRLLRLVLLDSYRPNSIVEICLDGHTSFNGANGAGKTSLIRLIPLFYGESPAKIVRGGGVTQSFVDHYLPRSTSYIIFEYRRRDLTCMAVLHASRTGEHVCYRFIDQAFAIERFRDDSGELVAGTDLYRHIIKRGEACTEQITALSDYRAVIQNTVSKRELRALPGRYAFVGAGSRLAHIEKIATGMFTRATSFADVKRVIISCIFENTQSVRLESDTTTMDKWVKELRAYREIMARQADMDALASADARHRLAAERLANVHASFSALYDQLQKELSLREQELEAIAKRQSELNHKKDAELGQCNEQTGRVNGELSTKQNQREALLQRATQYANEKIEELAARVDRLPEYRESLIHREKRLNLLEAKATDLTTHYAQLRLTQQSQLASQVAHLRKKIDPIRTDAKTRAEARREAGDQAWQATQADFEARSKAGGDEKHKHAERLGELRAQVANPQASEACIAAEKNCVHLLEARREAHQQSKTTELNARQSQRDAEEARQVVERERAGLRQRLDKERRQHAHLLGLAQAAPGTLLHFLRANRPDWTQDIARVVPEELLLRTDLAPALSETEALALYGVTLDLSVIDAPRSADEEILRQEIALAQDAIHRSEAQLKQKDQEQEQANQRLAAANEAVRAAIQAVTQAGAEEASARIARNTAQTALENSKLEAKQAAQAEFDRTAAAIRECEGKLRQLAARRDELRQQHVKAVQQDIETIEGEANRKIEAIEAQVQAAEQTCKAEIEAIDREEKGKLQAAGVDTEAVTALRKQIEAVQQDIHTATAGVQKVAQWRIWHETEWAGKAQLEASIEALIRTLESLAARRQRIEERHAEATRGLQTQRTTVEKRQAEQQRELGFVDARRSKLSAWPPTPPTTPIEAYSRDYLEAEMDRLLREIATETRNAQTAVNALKRTMYAHAGTAIGDYYERRRTELGPDQEQDPFAWVEPMREWFDTAHIDARRLLAGQCRTFALGIYEFRNRLSDFSRKVRQFSQDLQRSMAASIQFRAIHAIAVRLTTSFDSVESWSRIKTLADEYDQWAGSDADDLPPESFALAVENVTRHLQGRHTVEVRLEDLLGIEIDIDEHGRPRKTVKDEAQLKDASSNGLSYLILCALFVGLVNKIRRDEPVTLVWALDELRDLDIGNVHALLKLLRENHIHLASAYPDPDPDILALFANRYTILEGRRVASFDLPDEEPACV